MKKIYVGVCGWEYLQTRDDKLRDCARLFDAVEVNSTFYSFPSMKVVRSWRSRVPSDFVFTMKAHKIITHVNRFKLNSETIEALKKTAEIYFVGRMKLLVLQVPFNQPPEERFLSSLSELLRYVNDLGIKAGVEARGYRWRNRKARMKLKEILQRYEVTHVFDASYEEPVYHNNVIYSRIYGKGYHTLWVLDDDEIKSIAELARRYAEKGLVFLMAHGCKMYDDAIRMKEYIYKDVILPIYIPQGVPAIKRALMEKPVYPATKKQLIRDHGWKVVDLNRYKRVRFKELLEKIDDRVYRSVDEVVEEVKRVAGIEG